MSDWLEDAEDWIDDDGPKRPAFSPQSGLTGIVYRENRCPNCKSLKIAVQNTKRVFIDRARYIRRQHTCEQCGLRFKSFQLLQPDDVR